MKLKISAFLLTVSIFCSSQTHSDHLIPTNGIFGLYDFEFEYYSKLRKILFKDLSDISIIGFQVIPSFGPENILVVQYGENDGKLYMIYRICEKQIWQNEDWVNIKIREYKKEIDFESLKLVKSLFLKEIKQTRYYEEEVITARDGISYYFSVWDDEIKMGMTRSPKTTHIKGLVNVGYELIKLVQNNEPIIIFNEDFIKKLLK